MAEEGSVYRAKQRQSLLIADNIYLNLSLSKFCLNNCGVLALSKLNESNNDLESDCIKNCTNNIEKTFDKFTEKMKEQMVLNSAFSKEE